MGASHPDTARSLNNLAILYQAQERYQEAELLMRRAVMICQESLGMEHPVTQQLLKHYILLLADLHTNGDVEALLHLLAQTEQDSPRRMNLRHNTWDEEIHS
ncbi:hypothetical protein KSF_085040 [Reticulibacter mediterranei]|uniref:Tetratricopeptide repeat protein n=1 Tax=Reticulibacter mediterranei TaxID=2778369 RepID=A0A8J3IPP2_9CHLR|nr:hypothetical protein KSF_085040 [Reticulibacter mediterranei]